jgi:hypothetical protein
VAFSGFLAAESSPTAPTSLSSVKPASSLSLRLSPRHCSPGALLPPPRPRFHLAQTTGYAPQVCPSGRVPPSNSPPRLHQMRCRPARTIQTTDSPGGVIDHSWCESAPSAENDDVCWRIALRLAGNSPTFGGMTARAAASAASSYSTGGGGVVLEHRYGAMMLASLLTEDPVQELGDDALPLNIRFQASPVSAVDDMLLSGLAPDGSIRKAAIAVRRAPSLIPSDDKSVKLIGSFLTAVCENWDEISAGQMAFGSGCGDR